MINSEETTVLECIRLHLLNYNIKSKVVGDGLVLEIEGGIKNYFRFRNLFMQFIMLNDHVWLIARTQMRFYRRDCGAPHDPALLDNITLQINGAIDYFKKIKRI